MKFLIQKINGEILHDFSFTLLESIKFLKWSSNGLTHVIIDYLDFENDNNDSWVFESTHGRHIPIGSVEFVSAWFKYFYNHTPLPINVPNELLNYGYRKIFNGDENSLPKSDSDFFVKSNDKIKSFTEIVNSEHSLIKGNYQISELIEIDSEWRCFVYKGELVGLQNYSGDFKMFPNLEEINYMIKAYTESPIAYTLDVGVHDERTFVIEVHDFFSCGLYGFSDHKRLPFMHIRWHDEYANKLKLS